MPASRSSWKCEPFTEGAPLPYRASFDSDQFALLKEGLVPDRMEDKWFIYYEEPHLFLHRSWTGKPIYRVTLRTGPTGAEVTEVLLSKDTPERARFDLDYQVRLLDFLVSNLLLRQAKPFPVPPGQTGLPGALQHHISGTGYPESGAESKKR
jgi:hypothetical protein